MGGWVTSETRAISLRRVEILGAKHVLPRAEGGRGVVHDPPTFNTPACTTQVNTAPILILS